MTTVLELDEIQSLLDIPLTKNGYSRTIPLTAGAISQLRELGAGSSADRLMPLSAVAVRHAWRRITERADIDDLHFHDLRHEAISRFFEPSA